MRVLLVTWTDQLLQKLSILSPELEYCAIVVDEVEPAKKILERIGLSSNLIHPLYELKECVKDFYCDYVLCLESGWNQKIAKVVSKYGVPKNKILVYGTSDIKGTFFVERTLRYFKEHAAEFEIFATGMSYTELGLDVRQFKRKLFNFGYTSQDLYYNFQVAKRAVLYGGGHKRIRYALIGLAPYSFHYDQSSATNMQFSLTQYLIAFDDLHNFFLSPDVYRQFFRREYLSTKVSLEPFDVNNVFFGKTMLQTYFTENALQLMKNTDALNVRDSVDKWAEKTYPETRDENIKILDEYLTLCGDNNIRPIMFLAPMSEVYKKYFSRQKLDEFYWLVRQACKKNPTAIFIDGWKLQGITDADFRDIDHMNIMGAAKFSSFLNDFIERLDG